MLLDYRDTVIEMGPRDEACGFLFGPCGIGSAEQLPSAPLQQHLLEPVSVRLKKLGELRIAKVIFISSVDFEDRKMRLYHWEEPSFGFFKALGLLTTSASCRLENFQSSR
jgi:hypothetical protein